MSGVHIADCSVLFVLLLPTHRLLKEFKESSENMAGTKGDTKKYCEIHHTMTELEDQIKEEKHILEGILEDGEMKTYELNPSSAYDVLAHKLIKDAKMVFM